MKRLFSIRTWIQAGWTLATNPFLGNFLKGKIYQGRLKNVCVPGLNCYSCPAAAGACPLGSLQSFLSGGTFPAYVLGFLILAGVLLGRAVCGFLCPFGWIQELLHRAGGKLRRPKIPERTDRVLRRIKYAVLAVLVIGLPLFLKGPYGAGVPAFCKYLCPAGTLEAGVPLAAAEPAVRSSLGGMFVWKAAVLAAVLTASVLVFRPFCKYLCPLGAVYALFNRVSLFRLRVEDARCISCGKCESGCPMQVRVLSDINSGECIRCGKCMTGCPTGAIRVETPFIKRDTKEEEQHETV